MRSRSSCGTQAEPVVVGFCNIVSVRRSLMWISAGVRVGKVRADPKVHAMSPLTKAESVMDLTSLPVRARPSLSPMPARVRVLRVHVGVTMDPNVGARLPPPLCAKWWRLVDP